MQQTTCICLALELCAHTLSVMLIDHVRELSCFSSLCVRADDSAMTPFVQKIVAPVVQAIAIDK